MMWHQLVVSRTWFYHYFFWYVSLVCHGLSFSLYSILFINMSVHIAPTPGSSMLSASASSSSSWIQLHAGRLRHDHLIGHGSFEAMWKLGSHEKKAKKLNNNACQLFLAHGVIWTDASMFQMRSFMHVIYICVCVCCEGHNMSYMCGHGVPWASKYSISSSLTIGRMTCGGDALGVSWASIQEFHDSA